MSAPIRPTTIERRYAVRGQDNSNVVLFPIGVAPGRRIHRLASGHNSTPPSWTEIAVSAAAVVALVLFVFWLNAAASARLLR